MKLLIVEDDIGLHTQYKWALSEYELIYADSREMAMEALRARPELVLLDLGLPPDPDNASEGLALLSDIMSMLPMTKVIVLTGSEQKDHALDSVRLGAYSFMNKGASMAELKVILNAAARMQRLEKENFSLRDSEAHTTDIIGQSAAIMNTLKRMRRVARMNVSTLLSGESGTGKEMFARNMHEHSQRQGKFIPVNCASIPGELLESVLFGHVKGAFTGAIKSSEGLVKSADGGTLFLDEVGDMPLDLQAKLLRFLQEKTIQPVGSAKPESVDVRIVCATHQNLPEMVSQGKFREDLYFRLAEFLLQIPPLRDRDADIVILATKTLDDFRKENGREGLAKGFSNHALSAMLYYSWPGNVRELQNRIKSALIECDTTLISPDDLGLSIPENRDYILPEWFKMQLPDSGENASPTSLEEHIQHVTVQALFMAYRRHKGNISRAAEELGITRPTFYSRCEKFDMKIENAILEN